LPPTSAMTRSRGCRCAPTSASFPLAKCFACHPSLFLQFPGGMQSLSAAFTTCSAEVTPAKATDDAPWCVNHGPRYIHPQQTCPEPGLRPGALCDTYTAQPVRYGPALSVLGSRRVSNPQLPTRTRHNPRHGGRMAHLSDPTRARPDDSSTHAPNPGPGAVPHPPRSLAGAHAVTSPQVQTMD